ncbi:MAG: response regulator transcription factor [Anaerolineae bacterium]|nr:MAG: response regulator transcription factor [Anaerolineae bacterium]
MRVLLADDHTQIRWALRTAIREEPGLIVVGEVSEAQDLFSQAKALQPDLILLDWELPGQPADGLLSSLRALDCHPRVLVLSQRRESEKAALAAGADAFVSKADPPEQLLNALRRLVRR